MRTGTIEILNLDGFNFLKLTQINHDGTPKRIGLIEIPEIKIKESSIQPRWLKGSYLTPDQIAEETYQRKNHIA